MAVLSPRLQPLRKFSNDCRMLLFWSQLFHVKRYSHLSNKCEVTLTDFEKFHPPQKKSTLHVYWFLRFFPPSTPRLLPLCTSFFQKISPSTFIPTSSAIKEMRLSLLKPKVSSLHHITNQCLEKKKLFPWRNKLGLWVTTLLSMELFSIISSACYNQFPKQNGSGLRNEILKCMSIPTPRSYTPGCTINPYKNCSRINTYKFYWAE